MMDRIQLDFQLDHCRRSIQLMLHNHVEELTKIVEYKLAEELKTEKLEALIDQELDKMIEHELKTLIRNKAREAIIKNERMMDKVYSSIETQVHKNLKGFLDNDV